MITVKNRLSINEEKKVRILLQELTDIFSDFYITKNRLRLYIIENPDLLFKSLNSGDKIIFDDEGMVTVIGWSDKSPRKYIKLLSKNEDKLDRLLKNMIWKIGNIDLWWKGKLNNPIKKILEHNGFKYFASRGEKEILLLRKPRRE